VGDNGDVSEVLDHNEFRKVNAYKRI